MPVYSESPRDFALQIRGTPMMRVMTNSRSDDSAAYSFFVLIRLLLCLQLVEVIGQAMG